MTKLPLPITARKFFLSLSSLLVLSLLSGAETSGARSLNHPDPPIAQADLELSDPASQVAPPGLQVEPGDDAIPPIEQMKMRRELRELLGRVESAQLAANATEDRIGGRAKERNGNDSAASLTETADAIAEARRVLQGFSNLVSEARYGEARSQWLQARQLLWESYPDDRHRAEPEIRAIWLDRGSIVRAGSPERLARVFDRLQSAGINTVFFETINAGYPIYPSRIAPEPNPLIHDWDPLASAVELAHDRNMELHAWMWTFAVGNGRHNEIVEKPVEYPGPAIAEHPDWANFDDRGRIRHWGSGKTFLDPANSEARWYLMRVIDEIVTRYDVDGLHLDYIRYPFQDPSAKRTYGYGRAARDTFMELAGVDPLAISTDDRELWQQWTDFRTHQINSFVAEVSDWVRGRNPDLILSVAVFPQSQHDRIHKIQQDWEVWARNGWVDLVVPMTYSLDTNRLKSLAEPLLGELDSVLIVPSVKLHNLPEMVALDQIQALRDLPVAGYALFAAEMLRDPLHEIFTHTQAQDLSQPIPYRQPFTAAAARFAALRQEWEFMLAQDRLWIEEPALGEWQGQTVILAQALESLAAAPTAHRLATASDRLGAFQRKFDEWMKFVASENSYQVQTWENRLATLETLLRYGDRVEIDGSVASN